MADLSITAASVAPASDATFIDGTAGATITQGQPVYSDSSDSGKIKPADANASAATAASVGIAVNAAASGQPVRYQTNGGINLGATLTVGTTYIVSATAGGICPMSDKASGWYNTILGTATSASNLQMNLKASGALTP